MDLDEESMRAARTKFAKILLFQISLTMLPLLFISAFLFMGSARNVAELSWDRVYNFYASVNFDPNEGLAALAVVAAVVIALSLDGSTGNFKQFNYSEFVFAYYIKKSLLVACGTIVNYIAFFAMVDLLFVVNVSTNLQVNFSSFLVIFSALVILVLSAARVRHRQIEESQISFLIEKEQKKNNIISLRWKSRWGRQLPPWQRIKVIHGIYAFSAIVLSWAATVAFMYLGTGVRWNFANIATNVILESLFVFVFPFLTFLYTVHSIRNKIWVDLFAIGSLLLLAWLAMFYLVWHGLQLFNDYPILSAIWIVPLFMMVISSVSIFISPRNNWPLWLLIFRPVNKLYYLLERSIENTRIKTHSTYILRLANNLDKV